MTRPRGVSSGGAVAVDGGLSKPAESAVQWQFWEGKAWTGRHSAAHDAYVIAMRLGAGLDADPQNGVPRQSPCSPRPLAQAAKADELKRWSEFWSRSHVIVNPAAKADDAGWLIGRNYQLFRYMLACNRGGELPLLFNGGIFTTDNNRPHHGATTMTNCRLSRANPSRPISAAGWAAISCRRTSAGSAGRHWPMATPICSPPRWPSTATVPQDRRRPGQDQRRRRRGLSRAAGYLGALLCRPAAGRTLRRRASHLPFLDDARTRLDGPPGPRHARAFRSTDDLSWIEGTVLFYDSFYRAQCKKRTGKELGDDGKLVIYPGNGLEFAGGATNQIEAVSGLKRITAGLLALPDLPASSRARLERISADVAGTPHRQAARPRFAAAGQVVGARIQQVGTDRDVRLLALPAGRHHEARDAATGPRHLGNRSGRPRPAVQTGLFLDGQPDQHGGLGLAGGGEEACDLQDGQQQRPPRRDFPAFFGPGHDWLPDHNWGGSGMTGVQEMLLAPEPGPNGKLNLFPAWPAEWDVDFKLHARERRSSKECCAAANWYRSRSRRSRVPRTS